MSLLKYKKEIIFLMISFAVSITLVAFENSKYITLEEKQEMYDNSRIFRNGLQELKVEKEKQERIEKYSEELASYAKTDEFKMKHFKHDLEMKYNTRIKELRKITWKISFYTDLTIENSKYGAVNARGERLQDGMIANNILSLGAKVLIDNKLHYVADRGSNKYFYDVAMIDVFVPRIPGESDNTYYKRVNNMGRVQKEGYIIK